MRRAGSRILLVEKPTPIINDPHTLRYVRGWCYHDQLSGLETEAPHILPKKSSWPTAVKQIFEQEITRAGFLPSADHAASYLYRAHPGPSWSADGVRALSAEAVAPHWFTGRFAGPSRPKAHMPRKYKALPQEKENPIRSLRTFFFNQDISCGVSAGNQPMPYFLRNADGDDLFFVQEGTGYCETELGVLAYEPGHYVWIPRGIAYRLVPQTEEHMLFHCETYGEKFQKPDTSITGDAAVFYHRNIEAPTAKFVLREQPHEVIVKAGGAFTSYLFPHHPMDVVGWDGNLFPFRLHMRDIQPITSWKSHVPPSAYCTFFGNGFEICSFVPRPVETGERSLPVPFDHINIDRDEVIFYSQGTFFSKDTSESGSMTFHPRGPSHGPHLQALEKATKRRDAEGAFQLEGYFILVETSQPLMLTPLAESFEDSTYINSWRKDLK